MRKHEVRENSMLAALGLWIFQIANLIAAAGAATPKGIRGTPNPKHGFWMRTP
jgi:hypothetical protein